ncbi:ATP-binding protein [Fusibacter sp. 3D3]|uniref:ATP-binding protein n=1 Tax=Fusibacter sp. 3D3 TaxID=1048380 RepID=UPI000853CC76|nr:ATP-binding protein [Fusibacter sp. 3D3]GAU77887.1 signal transduction histidine kinase [Fusibacter sp. 3D3]
MEEKKSIRQIIYHEYVKFALLPIVIVAFILMLMYFVIIYYVEGLLKETLLEEAKFNITEVTSREVKNINLMIEQIMAYAEIIQNENERLFTTPEAFGLTNGMPLFDVAENGVTYKTIDNGGASVWYSNLTPMNDVTLNKAIKTEAMDPIFKNILEADDKIVGIYFNSYDSMNRYYPFLEAVYNVFEPNMDIPNFNFYYLADEHHNKSRKPVWTDVYLDPAGQGWMASCIVPIYNHEHFLEGVTGIDITIESIVNNILDLKLPWGASAFLVAPNGVILAMPETVEDIFEIKELRNQVYSETIKQDTLKPEIFNLFKNKDPQIAFQIETFFNSGSEIGDFEVSGKSYFLTKSIISETGWSLLVLVDKSIIQEPVVAIDKVGKQLGVTAFIIMFLFYMVFLSYLLFKTKRVANNISGPIIHVADKTSEMIYNLQSVNFESEDTEIKEIYLLNENFNTMAKALSDAYNELENKVKQRTMELTKMYDNLQEVNEELKSANLQLIHQEKMASIGQLAAGVAHEINNPMGFIISNIALLQEYIAKLIKYMKSMEIAFDRFENTAITQEIISVIKADMSALKKKLEIEYIQNDVDDLLVETLEGTNRVKTIVHELRVFSRSEAEKTLADMNIALDNVINMIWSELKYKVEIIKDYGEISLTYCHVDQLKQVFINILLNAAHAIQENGTITLKTYEQEQKIIIVISDTGKGIPDLIISKIFDPFFTTKETGEGTGLGLSISYEIIKSHEGSISVVSKEGEGTTFTLSFPIVTVENQKNPKS